MFTQCECNSSTKFIAQQLPEGEQVNISIYIQRKHKSYYETMLPQCVVLILGNMTNCQQTGKFLNDLPERNLVKLWFLNNKEKARNDSKDAITNQINDSGMKKKRELLICNLPSQKKAVSVGIQVDLQCYCKLIGLFYFAKSINLCIYLFLCLSIHQIRSNLFISFLTVPSTYTQFK